MTRPRTIILRGKRVWLRPPRPADYPEFARLMKDSAVFHRRWLDPFRGRAQFRKFLLQTQDEKFFRFLICRKEDGALVGMISLFHVIRLRLQSACVGYWIGAPHVRQGYATEALRLLLGFAFTKLKLHRVEANIQPGNAPSLALVRRVGFKFEGRSRRYLKIRGQWRDHERWAVLKEDRGWRGAR